jgi:hypothetical protein
MYLAPMRAQEHVIREIYLYIALLADCLLMTVGSPNHPFSQGSERVKYLRNRSDGDITLGIYRRYN